ncbi:MAG: gamma-glutamyltransferase [Thermoleophilaceae bacterium]
MPPPQSFPQDAFIDPQTGQPIPFSPQRITSGMAVGVPGTLATWSQALGRYGTMSLSRLLEPAIKIAEDGFTVDQTLHDQTQQNLSRLDAFTSSRQYFLTSDRQAPPVGAVIRNPDLARAYALIADHGPGAFYGGPIGAAVVDTVRNPPVAPDSNLGFTVRPGAMTNDDVGGYSAPLREPTHVTYRGRDVHGMPPPSSGGSTVGEALNILEGYSDLSGSDRALALHRYLEASRFSFADRNRWVVLQILLDRFDFGMSLPEAIAAPRASQRNASTTNAEPGFTDRYGNELTSRFKQSFSSMDEIGAATGIELLPGGALQAAAEPVRRGGGDAEVVCPAGKPVPKSLARVCAAAG